MRDLKRTHQPLVDLMSLLHKNRAALLERYQAIYQVDAPSGLSRAMLERSIAYGIQEKAFGGLSTAIRKQLMQDRVVSRPKLSSESVLVREWHGIHHTVRIKDKGVEYRGEHFGSLSAVARRITGTHRSGNQFFALRDSADGA